MNVASLGFKFTAMVVLLVMLVLGGALLFTRHQQMAYYEKRLQQKAQFIQNHHSILIADSLTRNDDVMLMQAISRLDMDREIAGIVVVDGRGEVRYHPNPMLVATATEDPRIIEVLKSGQGILERTNGNYGPSIRIVVPLLLEGNYQPSGAVSMELTKNYIDQQISEQTQGFMSFAFGMLMTCGVLTLFFLRRWVLVPFVAFKQVAAGLSDPGFVFPRWNLGVEGNEVLEAMRNGLESLRTQLSTQAHTITQQQDKEIALAKRLLRSFHPGARILLTDPENRILWDSGGKPAADAAPEGPESRTARGAASGHVMDLTPDERFSALLSSALEQEGQSVTGDVQMDGRTQRLSVMSLPAAETGGVKTILLLSGKAGAGNA